MLPPHGRATETPSHGEKELREIKASNLSDTKFKVMVIRLLKEFSKHYKELS